MPAAWGSTLAGELPLPAALDLNPTRRMPFPAAWGSTPAEELPLPAALGRNPAGELLVLTSLGLYPAEELPVPATLTILQDRDESRSAALASLSSPCQW